MVLATFNIADFARLHGIWMAAGRGHSGILLISQQKWGPGELARRIIRTLVAGPDQDFRNRIAFLSSH